MSDALIAALRNQQRLDEDGVVVGVSRQAVDEAADEITCLRAEIAGLREWQREAIAWIEHRISLEADAGYDLMAQQGRDLIARATP